MKRVFCFGYESGFYKITGEKGSITSTQLLCKKENRIGDESRQMGELFLKVHGNFLFDF